MNNNNMWREDNNFPSSINSVFKPFFI
jgi:hypothetical protein